jgi:aryl-alcohol dehydrogenase-like predicted oxidoreductase
MIPKKLFGRTGHESTRTLFGAASLSQVTQEEADQTLEVLLKYGVNHIDTAASYGEAELRIGPWMGKHRQDFFLATKSEERTYDAAKAQVHSSLERLQVEQIDLWQMHALFNPDEWEIAMGANGALKAFIEAREQGLVRFLGVTGHSVAAPSMHLRSLERFDFDAVLLPYNFILMQNPQYAADFEKLSALCRERNVAVQTIKSLSRGPIGEKPKVRSVWYDPLEDDGAIERAVHWVLGNSQVFLNTVGDIHLLPKVLEAASNFDNAPSDDAMQQDIEEQGITPLFV